MTAVSVILPIYKVEPYIERCVRSLMEQTLTDVEFIFVDDATPDDSFCIARRIADGYSRNVRYLAHETNRGLPAARNTGLEAATGEFILHCDSDDWLEPDMLEKMFAAAKGRGADFVYCDYFLSFVKERYMAQTDYADPMAALQEGMMTGRMKHNVWNKLISRKLYDDYGIRSPEAHCKGGEDFMVFKLLRVAGKTAHVPEALYHYNRKNVNAITKKNSERHYNDIKANADDVLSFLDAYPIADPQFLQYFKLDVKLPLLMERDREQYARWQSWYPEANAYIASNKYQSLRTRLIEKMANRGLFPMVSVYSWAVDKLFYGLMFNR